MDKRYQVFVSSTYVDLQEERQSVFQTLMEMDCIPAGMELFPAADDEQLDFIKRIIDDCDYYILIVGGRYGSITAEGVSYTEKEYEYAKQRGLKILAFIHEKPEEIVVGKSDIDPKLRLRLSKFRDKASRGRLVKFWLTAKELPGLVALSLSKIIKSYPAIGWVRADKVANLDLLEEVNLLQKRNQELEKLVLQQKSIFSDTEEREFEYIWDKADKLTTIVIHKPSGAIKTTVYKTNINLRELYSKLTEIYSHQYDSLYLNRYITKLIKGNTLISDCDLSDINTALSNIDSILNELVMYGLAETVYTPPNSDNNSLMVSRISGMFKGGKTDYIYTPKMHRFKYWLAFNKLLPKSFGFSKIELVEDS